MGSLKDTKRRQKEILKEWKGLSTQYAKNIKSIEDLATKAGTYFIIEDEYREECLPGIQNDDIVLWEQHITRAQNQINGSLTQVRQVIKQHKNIKKITKGGKLTTKRNTSRRLIKLDHLLKHLEDYAELTDNLYQNVKPTDNLIQLGNKRVIDGELEEDAAVKLREELVMLNSRWNKINEKNLRYVDRCDKFVLEILKNYKELKLWMVKCDNMIQWLTECEKLLERQSPISTDQTNLKEQLQDIKEFLDEGKKYQPSAFDVLSSGDRLYNHNRLDKRDIRYVYKTVVALRNRWNITEDHIEKRYNEITSRLNKLRKEQDADHLGPWKEKADHLNKSLNQSQCHLESIDAQLKDDDKYDTLKECTKKIQSIEADLFNQNSEDLTEVSSVGTAWTNNKKLSEEDDQEVQEIVNVLHDKMSGLEHVVKLQKERLHRSTANLMSQSVTECEQNLNDLDNKSLENFSAVGGDVNQVQGQIQELQSFEEEIEEHGVKFQRILTQFQEAADANMLDEPNKNKIGARIKELDWRYKELWREHEASKHRILQALLIYSTDVINNANNWLEDAESQADKIYKADLRNEKALELALTDQEFLSHNTATNENNIINASLLCKIIVNEEVIQDQNKPFLEEEMELLPQRLENLKKRNRDNQKRLNDALAHDNPKELSVEASNTIKAKEAVKINKVVEENEFEAELPEILDDHETQLASRKYECFKENEHSNATPRDSQAEVDGDDLGQKIAEFHFKVQYMNKWTDESNYMVDDFYKNMHGTNAWILQVKVEDKYDELDQKQKKMDIINKMGKEITLHSSDQNISKAINEEMFHLNNNWRECQSSLRTACEVQVQRTGRRHNNTGCCLITVIRRKITTLCSYN